MYEVCGVIHYSINSHYINSHYIELALCSQESQQERQAI